MAGLTWTKKHVGSMVEALDQDYDSIEDAARAALDTALNIIEERAKFAVVGQVYRTAEHGEIPPSHPAAVRMALGFFESDTKAREAAGQLTYNTAGDQLKTWVVPTFFGTPAMWHKERRDYYADLQAKVKEKAAEKMKKSIEEHREAMMQRWREIEERERKAGGQGWPCPSNRIKAGGCKHEPTCR